MADLFEVTAHSITVETKGLDHNGDDAAGRHWRTGALVELSTADAAVLVKSGAVKAGSKPVTQAPTNETSTPSKAKESK